MDYINVPLMKVRFTHFLIIVGFSLLCFGGIKLLDSSFTTRGRNKSHRFDFEFSQLMTNYRVGNYDEVITKANKINANCNTGINQIRALSYLSLSNIKTNNFDEGKIIYLFSRNAYSIFNIFKHPATQAEYIINLKDIISNYVPQAIASSSKELVNGGLTYLPYYLWVELFLMLVVILSIHEKIWYRIANKIQIKK